MTEAGQRAKLPLLAAAMPVVLAILAVMVFVAAEVFGRTLFSPGPEQNLAEAAALGRLSEVVRFLDEGQDPRQIVSVRPHAISSSVTRVTALEAAVWHRSAALIALFDRAGAIGDADTRHHLTCLASDLKADEIVRYLTTDGAPHCVPESALSIVVSRSKQSLR